VTSVAFVLIVCVSRLLRSAELGSLAFLRVWRSFLTVNLAHVGVGSTLCGSTGCVSSHFGFFVHGVMIQVDGGVGQVRECTLLGSPEALYARSVTSGDCARCGNAILLCLSTLFAGWTWCSRTVCWSAGADGLRGSGRGRFLCSCGLLVKFLARFVDIHGFFVGSAAAMGYLS